MFVVLFFLLFMFLLLFVANSDQISPNRSPNISPQPSPHRTPSPQRSIETESQIQNEPPIVQTSDLADALNISLQISQAKVNKPAPRYYFGNITRQEAEQILAQSTSERVFLVRDSSKAGNYALSKYDPLEQVKKYGHLLITSEPDWFVKESRDLFHYSSLEELISKTILLHGYIPIGQLFGRK
jgi:hypothetical protein